MKRDFYLDVYTILSYPISNSYSLTLEQAKFFRGYHIPLRRSLYLNFNYLVSVTAGGPVCPRGHMYPSSTVDFG